MSFEGRTAMITGAAGGIGEAVATTLAQRGAALVLVDYNEEALLATSRRLPAGTEHICVVADVSSEDDVDRAFTQAVERFGRIDLLHNNAGVLDVAPMIEATMANFDRIMRINARGAFMVLRRFLQLLVSEGAPGAAVNTSSAAGLKGTAGVVAYSMSKQAVAGLTRSAAVEMGPHSIRINAVLPGRIATPMIGALDALGDQQKVVATRPIGREASPYEVANLVVWLLSDEASFATGCTYPIDGGLTA